MSLRKTRKRQEYEQIKDQEYRKTLRHKLANNDCLTLQDRQYLHYLLLRTMTEPAPEQLKDFDMSLFVESRGVQTDPCATVTDVSEVVNYLKLEISKPEPDALGIKKCMDATFDHRRTFIVQQLPRIRTVFDIYPTLFELSEVIAEFCRIKRPDMYEVYLKNLKLYSKTVLEFRKSSVQKVIQEKRNRCRNSEKIEYVETSGAILLLPEYMKEDLNSIIHFKKTEPVTDFPHMICHAKLQNVFDQDVLFEVYVEKFKLCESYDLRCAFFALCGSYYIFNIQYPQACIETMAIVERLLLEIPPEMQEPTPRVAEIEKLLTLQCKS